jgi:hypothetical protein
LKKGVGSEVSQRYGSGDPDPHQNVTDPQHCKKDPGLITLIAVVGIGYLHHTLPFATYHLDRKDKREGKGGSYF